VARVDYKINIALTKLTRAQTAHVNGIFRPGWDSARLNELKTLHVISPLPGQDYHNFLKADFQSSHEAPRRSLRVHTWALSSNHNAKQLILIRCKHSQRAARSFVRGLENRLYSYICQLLNGKWKAFGLDIFKPNILIEATLP
jgi:hypothetical protein